MADLVSRGLRTICFAKSRRAAELIHRFTVERLGDAPEADRLAPYRAGYTPQQRREIERRLVEGELLGVTATDALELGIDIGLLDCAISVGFPGTVASLRQQWGRAGRRGHGLAVLIASEDALDQYFMREPETLLGRQGRGGDPRPREPPRPRRPRPRRRLRGAARRRRPRDARRRGPRARGRAARAAPDGDAGFVWGGRDYPAARTPLRSTSAGRRSPSSTPRRAPSSGVVERERAYSTVHEGAIYLHLGEQYLVTELDHGGARGAGRAVHRRLVHAGRRRRR